MAYAIGHTTLVVRICQQRNCGLCATHPIQGHRQAKLDNEKVVRGVMAQIGFSPTPILTTCLVSISRDSKVDGSRPFRIRQFEEFLGSRLERQATRDGWTTWFVLHTSGIRPGGGTWDGKTRRRPIGLPRLWTDSYL
jgi:hypothetical protein